MAPVNPDIQTVQDNIKHVIQDLFQILAQISNYDSTGRPSRDALAQDLQTLSASLRRVHESSSSLPAHAVPGIPEPLVQYVENGRNPDIYTREFVELVRRLNQLARGKAHAFRDFRDVLAAQVAAALPEVRADVRRVLDATGGETPGVRVLPPGAAGEEEGGEVQVEGERAQGRGGNNNNMGAAGAGVQAGTGASEDVTMAQAG